MGFSSKAIPEFPWDSLAPARERAAAHPGGIVDLSIGTPVDPTPLPAQEALRAAADSPGYPEVAPESLRRAIAGWFSRRRGAEVPLAGILPTIGSKELVAHLPALLGLGPGDTVVHPAIAYPTYDVGARLAGATPLPDGAAWPSSTRLVWVNSPANPNGHVLSVSQLAGVVERARSMGAVVASDECYAELAWEEPYASRGVPSLLDPRVNGGDLSGLLTAYSLSKQSNLAGYRAAFLAGDPKLIGPVLEIRRHSGMMIPAPTQAAMEALLSDDGHVVTQRERYRARREKLRAAVEACGLNLDPHSVAGLYLWAGIEGIASSVLVDRLAERGVLVAPGSFYGPAGEGYVRIALTASDERIAAACRRLAEPLFGAR